MEIRKVAVIGAGVMGSGIAAHVANAGVPVMLLDIPAEKGDSRSAIAEGALARMLKADPSPFMHPRNARLVSTGNLEDDLSLVADCDWIIEAVIERVDVKRDLYATSTRDSMSSARRVRWCRRTPPPSRCGISPRGWAKTSSAIS
jgi:3-hydroxyacyl-CoA dehydrogenase